MREINSFQKFNINSQLVSKTYDYTIELKDGTKLVDTLSGLWCTPLGYSQDTLKTAAYEQSLINPYYNNYLHTNNEVTEQFAIELCEITDTERVYFTTSGSAAVETAIKIALHINPSTNQCIVCKHSYHGSTILSANASDHKINKWAGNIQDPLVTHKFANAEELEQLINLDVAFIIVEPIIAAGGVYQHSPEVFKLLKQAQDQDILIIFDETVTGFGKIGPMFAQDHYNFKPDILVLGKGISNGYFPLSATLLNKKVSDQIKFFNHGFTASGHPIGSAVGLEMLKLCKKGFDHSRFDIHLSHEKLVEHRHIGCMGAIQFTRMSQAFKFIRVMREKGYMLEVGSENVSSVCYCLPYIMSDHDYKQFMHTISETMDQI